MDHSLPPASRGGTRATPPVYPLTNLVLTPLLCACVCVCARSGCLSVCLAHLVPPPCEGMGVGLGGGGFVSPLEGEVGAVSMQIEMGTFLLLPFPLWLKCGSRKDLSFPTLRSRAGGEAWGEVAATSEKQWREGGHPTPAGRGKEKPEFHVCTQCRIS